MPSPDDELGLELALDRIGGALDGELPAHLRAYAEAHAAGASAPAAPAILQRADTLVLAQRAAVIPALAARARALLRLTAPLAIANDPAVRAATAAPTSWPALADLATARDRAALTRFGRRAIAVIHELQGTASEPSAASPGALGPPIAGWSAAERALGAAEVRAVWEQLAARHGATGGLAILPSATARPRAFVVRPGAEVIVVIPAAIATPAARFAVLHELGHAIAALLSPVALPRALDEAVAASVARELERDALPAGWASPVATAARARRTALARALAAIEAALPALATPPIAPTPPWALWHDPGAQASYVAAERIAERWALAPDVTLATAITSAATASATAGAGLI